MVNKKVKRQIIAAVLLIITSVLIYYFTVGFPGNKSKEVDKSETAIVKPTVNIKDSSNVGQINQPTITQGDNSKNKAVIITAPNNKVEMNDTKIENNYTTKEIKSKDRRVNKDDLNRIKNFKIPLAYEFDLTYEIEAETAVYAEELANVLEAMGYKLQKMATHQVLGRYDNPRFDILINDDAKKVSIYVLRAKQ